MTASSNEVERIVIDSGRDLTIAGARNAAIDASRGPILLFWDGRLWPMPGLLEYCLDVHAAHPAPEDSWLVGVTSALSLRRSALLHWLTLTGRFPGQPQSTAVYAWPHFRIHALSCKRALLAHARFDPGFQAGEDLELACRLIAMTPLKVWYEANPQGVFQGPVTLETSLEEEYLDGYFRKARIRAHPRARTVSDVEDRFAFPERFLLGTGELGTLLSSVRQLEATLDTAEPAFASDEQAERLGLVYSLYDAAFAHAAARGWLDAESERAPDAARSRAEDAVTPRRARRTAGRRR
jgi:hypothetical protein